MSTPAAPPRCLDALPESDPLRSSLAAAVRDRPSVDVDRVYRGVIAIGGGPSGGGGGDGGGADGIDGDAATAGIAAGATKLAASGARVAAGTSVAKVGGAVAGGGALAKTLAIGLFGAASVGTAWWIGSDSDTVYRDEPVRAAAPTSVASASAATITAGPPGGPPPGPPAEPAPATSAPLPAAPASAPAKVDDEAEMSLLREASGAIASNPARALALVDEAERRFARGTLAQERDVIRVQALVAAGRRDEALQRARTLLARTPSSAHRPRLEQILPELAAD
jgi:hypothetical protein